MKSVIQIRGRGNITLPVDLRRKYSLAEGAVFTIIDLGDGSFIMVPKTTQVDRYGDKLAQAMDKENLSLDEMLKMLDQERKSFYRERYVKSKSLP